MLNLFTNPEAENRPPVEYWRIHLLIENTLKSISQKKANGKTGWMVLIGLLTAFPALTTDMYLPALPTMGEHLNASLGLANLTLVLYFVFFSLSMLVWGPLSDRHGRKPILLTGVGLFVFASLLCMSAGSIEQLIVFRVFQAIGSGASSTVALAIVKDRFEAWEREKAFAIIGVIMGLAPVLAPTMGSLLLMVTSWRGIFAALAALGAIGFIGSIFREETIAVRSEDNLAGMLFRLVVVIRNPAFYKLLMVFAWMSIPILAFIAASTGVYMKHFALSKQSFSLFFAFNALFFMIGPTVYLKLAKRFDRLKIISAGFYLVAASGVLILTIGHFNPFLFALSVIPASLAGTMVRPPSTTLILEQQDGDTGSASSLINSSFLMVGSLGMGVMSLDWSNQIFPLGGIYLLVGLVCLFSWRVARRKCRIPESFLH